MIILIMENFGSIKYKNICNVCLCYTNYISIDNKLKDKIRSNYVGT